MPFVGAGLIGLLAELSPAVIGAEQLAALGDPERILTSINDPAALARAEASLAGSG
jgi:hypothetical protein